MTRPRIEIIDEQSAFELDHGRMTQWTARVLDRFEGAPAVNLLFTGDDEIQRLNREFLAHDYPTDVITFPPDPADGDDAVGEIVISVDTALREAGARGVDGMLEVFLYVVHGVLHLVGFDDVDAAAAREMHAETEAILVDLGFDVTGLDLPHRESDPSGEVAS